MKLSSPHLFDGSYYMNTNYHIRLSRRTPQQTHDFGESDWSSEVYESRSNTYSPKGGTDPHQREGLERTLRPSREEYEYMEEDYPEEGVYPRDSRSVGSTQNNYMQESEDDGPEGESADVYLTGPKAGSDMRVTRKRRADGSWETTWSKSSGNGWKKLPGPDNENFYGEDR
jgi:hypothetical protein